MCGGTRSETTFSAWHKGLSPRVRGNLQRRLEIGADADGEVEVVSHCGILRLCLRSKTSSDRPPACPTLSRCSLSAPPWCVRRRFCSCSSSRSSTEQDRRQPLGVPRPALHVHVPEPLDLSPRQPLGVYPRVCGGTNSLLATKGRPRGLSPRVRGNRAVTGRENPDSGSIPACAGEPLTFRRAVFPHRVYPRVCGGTVYRFRAHTAADGLSPRVRGNHEPGGASVRGGGSIPACAGEPRGRMGGATRGRVYPRVCGGTQAFVAPGDCVPGLSPRVRGNRRPRAPPRPADGSIPACAGEPPGPATTRASSRVYPRVCGGTCWGLSLATSIQGLSPRVRGNHPAPRAVDSTDRSIPACAGEPAPHSPSTPH